MKVRRPLLTSVLASLLLLSMGPMPAPIYMNIPAGEMLRLGTRLELKNAVLCDGSVRLEPGSYDLHFKSMGDGSVHVTISGNGKTCHATGKVQGHDGIIIQGGLQPGATNAVVVQGGKQPSKAPSFATMGFTPQSQAIPQIQGNHLNVIVNGQGTNQILIGLLLPAVQKSFGDGSVHPGGANVPSEHKVQPVGK